ncbi:MAG: DUF1549 domain-containing protein [Planctomycetes bacterium]|nr:DUF1549 domain-containing protein [Planctomycetota bacterium]
MLPLAARLLLLALQAPPASDVEFFEARIRPLFVTHCYECHSTEAGKAKGGLKLDTGAALAAGGDSGAVLVPGDPDASLLVTAVRYGDLSLQMPPKAKLSEREIADLVEWVRRGAHDPRAEDAPAAAQPDAARSEHWAFQPLGDPAPPAVVDERWPRQAIDRFVLARLEAEGLAPAQEADRRTLLRRVTFDLVGLPPTEADVEAFLSDPAPDAYERVVDRLLASPRHGERWARTWLDLARYADSNGLDENLAMAHAWRYRDWVIDAFNRDLPYGDFVTQQLAGDLLPEPADAEELARQRTATGFLVLGPKMLAEQDKVKLERDTVDEQIDVASKAFLGLTVSCARCHDHKHDPISQRDYTALAGVFQSTKTLGNRDFVSRWNELELAPAPAIAARDAHAARQRDVEARARTLRERAQADAGAAWRKDLARYLVAANAAARGTLLLEAEAASRGNLITDADHWGDPVTTIARTGGAERPQYAEYDVTTNAAGTWTIEVRHASEAARPIVVSVNGVVVAPTALDERTGGWFPDAQRWTRVATAILAPGRNVVRLDRAGDFPHLDALLLTPESEPAAAEAERLAVELELEPELVRSWALFLERRERGADPVFAPWHALSALAAATFADDAAGAWAALRAKRDAQELDLAPSVAALLDAPAPASLSELAARYQAVFGVVETLWDAARAATPPASALADAGLEELRQLTFGARGPFALTRSLAARAVPDAARAELEALDAEAAGLKQAAPAPFARALGVTDGAIEDLRVHVRGSHLNLAGEPVPRGFPAVLTAVLPAPPISADRSGRLELARWLAHPEHPLTWRVIANRVWQGHFGRGLVATPSNFGRRGTPPSHPELLDWLARELQRQGGSLKALHRLIVTSATYRTSSSFAPGAPSAARELERDPEHRWLARFPRRRLEAEAVRDALLSVSGGLDLAQGGSLLATENGGYVTNDQSANAGQYDVKRRSIYLPVVRNALYDLFTTFDYADAALPIDARSVTVDASQSLLLMNAPLAIDAATVWSRALLAMEGADDDARVVRAWRAAYGRAPEADELAAAHRHLAASIPHASAGETEAATSRERAWAELCQALFQSNEFLHVD